MASTARLVTKNPFATFAPNPEDVYFDEQEEGEHIVLLSRANLITLFPAFVFALILIFLPILLSFSMPFLHIDIFLELMVGQLFWLWLFWYFLVFVFAFYKIVFWYFNVYLITNERIIDFDFLGVFSKKISFTRLEQVEDVNPKISGVFGTFFNFGNVLIQTAAEEQEFVFENVSRPDAVSEIIFEQMGTEEGENEGKKT